MKIIIDISTPLLKEVIDFAWSEDPQMRMGAEEAIFYMLHTFMAHRRETLKQVKSKKK